MLPASLGRFVISPARSSVSAMSFETSPLPFRASKLVRGRFVGRLGLLCQPPGSSRVCRGASTRAWAISRALRLLPVALRTCNR